MAPLETIVTCKGTRCNTLQHTPTHSNTLFLSSTHCNTLQHTTYWYNYMALLETIVICRGTHCNTLQHTATHCNTLHTDTIIWPSQKPPTPYPHENLCFSLFLNLFLFFSFIGVSTPAPHDSSSLLSYLGLFWHRCCDVCVLACVLRLKGA